MYHPNTKEYTFFSAVYVTFSKTNHISEHKTSLYQFKKIEITPCIVSDHHRLKLEINNRILTNSRKLNNSLLNEK